MDYYPPSAGLTVLLSSFSHLAGKSRKAPLSTILQPLRSSLEERQHCSGDNNEKPARLSDGAQQVTTSSAGKLLHCVYFSLLCVTRRAPGKKMDRLIFFFPSWSVWVLWTVSACRILLVHCKWLICLHPLFTVSAAAAAEALLGNMTLEEVSIDETSVDGTSATPVVISTPAW